jgi:hypothetical protein
MSKRDVKKGIDMDESRRRRESNAISIRKDKKEESLSKRRNLTAVLESSAGIDISSLTSTGATAAQAATVDRKFTLADLPELYGMLQSNERDQQFIGMK